MSSLKQYKLITAIGRFEPPHLAHEAIFARALSQGTNLAIMLGSAYSAPNPDNPFTEFQRMEMIKLSLRGIQADVGQRVYFCAIPDYPYNDLLWEQRIQDAITEVSTMVDAGDGKVGLIGHLKDESSFYLKKFPQLELICLANMGKLNATDVRSVLFNTDVVTSTAILNSMVSPLIARYIQIWRDLPEAKALAIASHEINAYNSQFKSPYSTQHVTADAVVTCAGHILLIRRKDEPGKGLWAIPGGFVGPSETCMHAAIREFREETRIKSTDYAIERWCVNQKFFDAPKRSLRKRTFTMAHHFECPFNAPPEVRGGDDAEEAKWFTFGEFARMRAMMFEDHYDIIKYFTGISDAPLPIVIGAMEMTATGWSPLDVGNSKPLNYTAIVTN